MKHFIGCLLLVILPQLLFAQQEGDTLQGVEVRDNKMASDEKLKNFGAGIKAVSLSVQSIDQPLMSNLQNLLSQRLPVYVHSFGFNGAATLQLRGASAQQTQLIWKGVPLNNAVQGYSDLSAVPLFLLEDVQLIYSGSAALWGSGNVGGALSIGNDAPVFGTKNQRVKGVLGMGSFHAFAGGLSYELQSKRAAFSAKTFLQNARNDFPFIAQSATKKQAHAESGNVGLMLDAAYLLPVKKASNTAYINVATWWQKGHREIPAALFESSSQKQRKDVQWRSVLSWHSKSERKEVYAQSAFLREDYHYEDKAIALQATYRTETIFAEGGWKKVTLRPHVQAALFFPVQYATLHSESRITQGFQSKLGVVSSLVIFNKHNTLRMAGSMRYEWVGDKNIFLPGINGSLALAHRKVIVGLNAQRTYRLPTLNELYFFPGGNATLKPEQGWSADADVQLTKYKVANGLEFSHRVSGFARIIQDWIIWYGGAVWTPHNMAEVWSRGVEWTQAAHLQTRTWQWQLTWNATYLQSTTTKSYIPNDNSIGMQIPNTPRFVSLLSLEMKAGQFFTRVTSAYTGLRYTTIDQSYSVPGYHLLHYAVLYARQWQGWKIEGGLQVNNLLNHRYEVVHARPMPGRNFLLSIGVSRHSKAAL